LNDDDGWGARVGLKADFTDALSWSASFARIEADGENIINFQCNPANPSDCNGRFSTSGLREGATASTSPYAPLVISGRKANYLMGARSQTDLVTSNLEFDLNQDFKLSFITGYIDLTQQYALDFYDGRSGPTLGNPNPPVLGYARGGFTILNDGTNEQFSQEVKLNGSLFDGRAELVSGVYYIDEKNTTDFADIFANSLLLADRVLDNKTEALAGYAQADFNVTDEWKLTAGIRYTDETKKMGIRDNRPSCNDGTIEATCMANVNLISPSGKPIPRELDTQMWTPRFAVNYKPSGDVLMFASATKGMKSGGWNGRSTPARSVLPFGPEKVWSYEAGAKTDWLGNRLRANLTFFYLDVSDLQTPSALLNANGSMTFLTRNFADYENKGIELELTYMPIDGLTTYFNAGFQDDKYKIDRNAPTFDEYGIQSVSAQQALCRQQLATGAIPNASAAVAACAAGIITAEGNIAEPVRTPDLTLSFGASYDIPLGSSRMTLVPSLNASYRTEQEVSTNNLTIYSGSVTGTNGTFPSNPYGGDYITGSYSPEAWFVNATLTLFGDDRRWLVAAECTNCLNETAVNTALANTAYINAPMQWMLRTRFNF
ncbi:MAG TPA: TonB-dependent receptor, partial [Steroidobacter sp.]